MPDSGADRVNVMPGRLDEENGIVFAVPDSGADPANVMPGRLNNDLDLELVNQRQQDDRETTMSRMTLTASRLYKFGTGVGYRF